MAALLVFSAYLLALVAGGSVIRLIGAGLPKGAWLAAAFFTGTGAVSLQMFLYSLASVPFNAMLISAPWIAIAGALVFLRRRPADSPFVGRAQRRMGPVEALCIVIIALQSAYALFYAYIMPVSGWDAWLIWFLKARVFFIDGSVEPSFLLDPNYQQHQDYPLLVPLFISWVYTAAGAAKEAWGKLLSPLQFISLLAVFHYLSARATDRKTAAVFTALLSLTPVLVVHGGGLPLKIGGLYSGDFTGYADLALSASFAGGAAFLYLYLKEGARQDLFLSALFLGIGAWTKNEGLTFAVFGACVLGAYSALDRKTPWKDMASYAAIIAVFLLPWQLYRAHHHIESEYVANLSANVFIDNLPRLPLILGGLLDAMFTRITLFNVTWAALAASAAFNWRGFLDRPTLSLYALLVMQLSVYVLVYVITPVPIDWHLATSADRLLLHMLPLALFITAVNLGAFANGRGR